MIDFRRRQFVTTGLAAFASPVAAREAALSDTLAERIGRAVSGVRAKTLPLEVYRRVELSFADNLATLAYTLRASAKDPYMHRAAARRGPPEARIPGAGFATGYEDAAATLAFLIHYAETDESDFRASLRASPCVMGPLLALAQAPGVTGADMVAALVAGHSVQGGLGQPFGASQDDGLMAAGVWGPSAAAAVAARLLRLDAQRTAHALALAAGAAGGTFQYYFDQTEEKRIIVARAARAGVEAALLARDGEHGPRRAFEGDAGLFNLIGRVTASRPDTSGVAAAVEAMDGPLYLYPKFFSASASIIPSLEGLAPLVADGLRAPAVDRVVLRGDPSAYGVVAGKLGRFEAPGSSIGAKINYAYMMAFLLVHGAADAATVDAAQMPDPEVSALAARFGFEPAAGHRGEVVLHLKDGGERRAPVLNQIPGAVAAEASELRRMKIEGLTRPRFGAEGPSRIATLARNAMTAPSAQAWVGQVDAMLRV